MSRRSVLIRRFRCSSCRYATDWFDYHATEAAGHVMLDHIESEHPSDYMKACSANDKQSQLCKMFYFELPNGGTAPMHFS